MSGTEAEKQSIRKQLLANRGDRQERTDFSLRASQLIRNQPGLIASYSATQTEPQTKAINELLASEQRLVLPEIDGEKIIWRVPKRLEPGIYGVMRPIGPEVQLEQISLALAPALAVDARGNRLGKGGGYYDRALGKFQGLVYALVFESEFVQSLPVEAHDVKINGVITEKTIRTF